MTIEENTIAGRPIRGDIEHYGTQQSRSAPEQRAGRVASAANDQLFIRAI